jgi:predicted DNA-binding transcriptional regulator
MALLHKLDEIKTSVDYDSIPLDVFTLAKNQLCVLNFLIDNSVVRTSYNEISKHTNIGNSSCIAAVGSLVRKGFLRKYVVKNSEFQGFSCVLNKPICDCFVNLRRQNIHHTSLLPSDGLTMHSSNNNNNNVNNLFLKYKYYY